MNLDSGTIDAEALYGDPQIEILAGGTVLSNVSMIQFSHTRTRGTTFSVSLTLTVRFERTDTRDTQYEGAASVGRGGSTSLTLRDSTFRGLRPTLQIPVSSRRSFRKLPRLEVNVYWW